MYLADSDVFKHHLAQYGPQSSSATKDFIPKFRAEEYRPEEWAALFKKAGARYVMPVAEHHDGFPDVRLRPLGLKACCEKGPQRDLVGRACREVRKAGSTLLLPHIARNTGGSSRAA
jgi:alpha-L-fucosidase